MERIYLDHAATAPMHPNVIQKMVETMESQFGNPSSIHSFGREARHLVDDAREVLARSIGAKPNEIVFTGGGTEADNLAVIGGAEANKHNGKHIITTAVEHHAVLHACRQLERLGFDVTYLPVDETGSISIAEFKQALRDDTILVSIMYGNNEVGVIEPIKEVGELLKNHQALFHTDAVQAYGVETLDVNELSVDLLSVSAHKINGPKGIGFLYSREGVKLSPRTFGGEQERKRRAGTENVAAIAGFREAVIISQTELEERRSRYRSFKKLFVDRLEKEGVKFFINSSLDNSLPHVLNLSFPGTDVEAMLVNLDLAGIAASSGSACTAGSIDPSHVLVAMFGKDSDRTKNSIRYSFGLNNTAEQVEKAASETAKIVKRLTA
ncbi:cysteine desulfurase NifS [Bacillus canaveralius]|uniref:cysteine desulfurase n=1 Tax=Bacillus canaveralius TaxID=1403243 RepID=A0A2N5GGS5_9BACI|nr:MULTISPECIES: cysteine desulfurase family protein [Bacillus]PLR79946.1 cysteine desulfurase NifS [Bacillus canaveralius]PLR81883.1 cysteine desulfurase NifS [Bacillus sp. V33-4]PLR99956.1 cysteine desulfurase NifS [Bacillus canaveralius]RSK47256.1 cysteine desulfurase [Bacillus canaveralius]